MALPAGYTLEQKSWKDLTDDDIAEAVAFGNILLAELLPDDPPGRVEDAIASHRSTPERMVSTRLRVRDAKGQLVAGAGSGFDPEHDDNPDMCFFYLNVLPEERRKGIGATLLGHVIDLAKDRGCTRLVSHTNDLKPDGAGFARAVGADAKQATHVNHLPIEAVDRAELERWVADGPARAADYELIGWDGACPEEHLEPFVDLVVVMNTAPRDGLEMNDFTLSTEEWREQEERVAAVGAEVWTLVARHKSDGAFAGFHDVSWHESDPNTVWVGATGVQPEHRGHALGKWLKATMTLRILAERPQATSIRTGNADSNDAMLGINKLMGYRALLAQTTWEISVADAEAWLAARR